MIGNGSFGVVYQAKLCETGEMVAIKKVLQDKRFKNRELQIMRRLDHCNIVSLLYFFYTTRDALAATTRLDYLTDPLALWRIYWRWFGIVLLLCNASLLLAVGWARHR